MDILAVVAHPDDETLMCGGTLARFGGRVVVLAGGGTNRPDGTVAALEGQCRDACAVLGVTVRQFGYPDQRLDTIPLLTLTQAIESELRSADVVITHTPHDVNVDHRICYAATMAAARPYRYAGEIWCGAVPGSSEWWDTRMVPNLWVGLTEAHQKQKSAAFACYESEQCAVPHPRSLITMLNTTSGSTVNLIYAEAFTLMRRVLR